jgi:hypothetical protein
MFPAGKAAIVHLLDPEGHRLASVGRYLTELDPELVWIARPGGLAPLESEDGSVTGLWCKACRDSGFGYTFAVPVLDCKRAVLVLWQESQKTDTPRRRDMTVFPL